MTIGIETFSNWRDATIRLIARILASHLRDPKAQFDGLR
jgi:hypothetical protein